MSTNEIFGPTDRPNLKRRLGLGSTANKALHLRIIAGLAALAITGFGISPARATTINDGGFTITGTSDESDDIVFDSNGSNATSSATFDESVDLFTNPAAFVGAYGANTFNGTTTLGTTSGIQLDYGASLTNSSTGVIQGYGNITQYGGGTLDNSGLVDANNSSGTLRIGYITVDNALTMESTNGGALAINDSGITNTGGISSDSTGGTELDADTYSGQAGSSLNQTAGQLLISDSTLGDGTATDGVLKITGATGLTIDDSNDYLNTETVTGNLDLASINNALLQLDGANTFDSGTINLGTTNGIQLDYGATLTNGSDGVIQGYGTINQYGGGTLDNNGTIDANSSGKTLTISSLTVDNTATAESTSGGALAINSSTVTNTGAITSDSTGGTELNDDTYLGQAGSSLNQTSGELLASGTTFGDGTAADGILSITGSTGLTIDDTTDVLNTEIVTGNVDLATIGTAFLQLDGANTFDDGTINLGTSNGIQLDYNASLTNENDGVIQGFGNINEYGGGTLTNDGLVDANNSSANSLIINNLTVSNAATMESTDGGALEIENSTITNTGEITSDSTGGTELYNDTYSGQAGSSVNQTAGELLASHTTFGDGTATDGVLKITGSTGLTIDDSTDTLNTETVTGNLDLATINTAFLQLYGATTFDDGTITLGTSNGIQLDYDASLTNDSDGVIQGYGPIDQYGSGTLTNDGTIDANSDGNTLTISYLTFNNTATAESKNGGALAINNSIVTNTGAITSDSSGGTELYGDTYLGQTGGTLHQTVGELLASDTTFGDGTAADGVLNITGAKGLTIDDNNDYFNTETVKGNLDLATDNNAFLQLEGANTYDSGTIKLGTSNGIQLNYGASLTNESDGVIQGYGTIGEYGGGSLTNNGTVLANGGANALTISDITFTNTGKVNVIAGSTLNATDETQNAGTTNVNGTLDVNGGSGTLDINGGTLTGNGTVTGSVDISGPTATPTTVVVSGTPGGTIDPGSTPGLTIDGNYSQTGIWDETLTSATVFGTIDATGTFDLGEGSSIDVSLGRDFNPFLGETFDVSSFSDLVENDAVVNGTDGYGFTFSDPAQTGVLTVTQLGNNNAPAPESSSVVGFGSLLAFGALLLSRRRKPVA